MTETRRWFEGKSFSLRSRLIAAVAAIVVGLVLASFGLGLFLGRLGAYLWIPALAFLGWVVAAGAVGWGVLWGRRRLHLSRPTVLAREVELEGGLRHGSIVGVTEQKNASGSSTLTALADERAAEWLVSSGTSALGRVRKRISQTLGVGGMTLAAGALVFVGAGPAGSRAGQFWSPFETALVGRGPVQISVDRTEVPFGDSVRVAMNARGRRSVTLWVRAPGEPWTPSALNLDSVGNAVAVLGPLESDRFLRATSGGRTSSTIQIRIRLPAFLTGLELLARYPAYIGLADEPMVAGPDPVRLPVNTRIITSGRATVSLDSVLWWSERGTVPLEIDGDRFAGELPVTRSQRWLLNTVTEDGGAVDGPAPELNLIAVPDSSPMVAIPIPGSDTTVPASLRRSLVVDARDDYGLERVELVRWRVSYTGEIGDSLIESLPLSGETPDRAVVQWMLDLSAAGFLPGDTAYFFARAQDNAPRAHIGQSETYRVWLPSLAELRDAVRDMSEAIAEGTDSLVEEQRDLAMDMEDLAAERERSEQNGRFDSNNTPDDLPFNSVERARELAERQENAVEGTEALREELQELADAAWSAGITDPEFHRQLSELQDLLDKALTDELMSRMEALQEAIEELDPEAMREALNQMAQSAQGLQQQLSRGRELFERAAIEGEMETLAADAEDLAALQREWNEDVAGDATDSSLAAREEALTEDTRDMAAELQSLEEALEQARAGGEDLQSSTQRTEDAAGEMQNAAGQAEQGERQEAQQSGEAASEALDPVADELRSQREQIQEQWKQEVLDAMDRALVETANLAEGQRDVLQRLDRGEAGSDVTGELAAMRSGLDRLVMRLQGAAGRNALVSPQLGSALGFSRLRMSEALDQLQRANPNTRQAGEMAGEALDGLNAVALQLLHSRSDVASAQSGSGLSEAMERLAELAQQQGQLGEQTDELMSMLPQGVPQAQQELRGLAERQQDVADELDRMDAEGEVGGAEELAEEARELAALLEAARVDRETVERQEQLFRRLLDAGRTLRSEEEEEEREERESQTADPDNVRLPPTETTSTVGGPRFRFPVWEELRSLSPEERRLVLDYFRRLNSGRP